MLAPPVLFPPSFRAGEYGSLSNSAPSVGYRRHPAVRAPTSVLCEDAGPRLGWGCWPCGDLGGRREQSYSSVPRCVLWAARPMGRRPQLWREPELSTAGSGSSPGSVGGARTRPWRLRQRRGSGRREASGTVAVVGRAASRSWGHSAGKSARVGGWLGPSLRAAVSP